MIILDKKSSKASKLVKQILMDEYKLGEHLKLMRCIYMMESSHILDRFVLQFFSQVKKMCFFFFNFNKYCLKTDLNFF